MQYLLDTHTFLWFVTDSPKLSHATRTLLEREETEAFLSIASIWELAIKYSLGRFNVNGEFGVIIPRQLEVAEISLLPIRLNHCAAIAQLPFHHRDPFDRMIAALERLW